MKVFKAVHKLLLLSWKIRDAISLAGVAMGLPPLVAAGETISGAGTILNVAVDLSDGKSMTDIAMDKAPSLILGRIGGALLPLR